MNMRFFGKWIESTDFGQRIFVLGGDLHFEINMYLLGYLYCILVPKRSTSRVRSSGLLLMFEMFAESCRQPTHKHCNSIFAMKLLNLFLDKLIVTLRYVRCKIPGGKYWSNCCI